MSSDQITYVLVALIVTGVAIILLLAGAILARRGRGGAGQAASDIEAAAPAPAPVAYPPTAAPTPVAYAAAAAPALAPAPVAYVPAPAPVAYATAAAPVVEPEAAPLPIVSAPEAVEPHVDVEHPSDEAVVTAADLQAAARRVDDPREQDVIEGFLSISPRRREAAAFETSRRPTAVAPVDSAVAVAPAPGTNPPDPYIDEVTGLDSRAAWDRTLAEENARFVRYRRPVGVVVAELDGLARFEREFGSDAGCRILKAVGVAMQRTARRTDRVAHVGSGRFLVLLPETDEIQAINYVERVRGECERWLEAGAVALHVSMGWASPSAVGELDTALRTAEERMYAERRRSTHAGVADADASR